MESGSFFLFFKLEAKEADFIFLFLLLLLLLLFYHLFLLVGTNYFTWRLILKPHSLVSLGDCSTRSPAASDTCSFHPKPHN